MKKVLSIILVVLFLAPLVSVAITADPPAMEPDAAIERITSLVFGVLLAVAVLAIIYAGFLFITAGGKEESVTTARKMLLYAIIGIVVALLAQGIVNYLREMFS